MPQTRAPCGNPCHHPVVSYSPLMFSWLARKVREWRRARQTLREVSNYHAKSRQAPGLRPPGRARLVSVRGVPVSP